MFFKKFFVYICLCLCVTAQPSQGSDLMELESQVVLSPQPLTQVLPTELRYSASKASARSSAEREHYQEGDRTCGLRGWTPRLRGALSLLPFKCQPQAVRARARRPSTKGPGAAPGSRSCSRGLLSFGERWWVLALGCGGSGEQNWMVEPSRCHR